MLHLFLTLCVFASLRLCVKSGAAALLAPVAIEQDRDAVRTTSTPALAVNVFDLAKIAALGLVARIDYHESLGSTSDRALALGAQDATELPLLVLAERQTAGRGRGTNRWWTSDGALTFSLLLEAPLARLPPERWPQVALAAGVAVAGALQALASSADCRLKWPNDVYLNGRKVGGILSESIPGWRDRLVVGVGVNVNNRIPINGDKQAKLDSIAISLLDHDGLPRDLTQVLVVILDEFDRRWRELLAGRFELAAAAYRDRCLLTGRTVTIQQPGGQAVVGVCSGIDDFGALRLHTAAGVQSVVSGSVVRWDA